MKITIYVPDAIKTRMNQIQANWSSIACKAFEDHLKIASDPVALRKYQIARLEREIAELKQS